MAKNLDISILLDFYGDMLTEKQRDVVEFYYNEDLSLAEIAQNCGITRQGVRDSIKRAEAQLIQYEERLGLAERFDKIQSSLELIIKNAKDIDLLNMRYGGPREVFDHVEKIVNLASNLQE
ncbi:MAG: YlxM family DNA-binding protein [Oscillospiraceae bacterium]